MITKSSQEYSNSLKLIKKPPEKLYIKGNSELLNQKAIAIVGSRRCTEYGKKMANQIAYELAESGLVIVSGLAVRDRYRSTFRCAKIRTR